MPLELYKPKSYDGRPSVTMTPGSFSFSVKAAQMATMAEKRWVRIYLDHEQRLVVFELLDGLDRPQDGLKLQSSKKGHRSVTAKGLILNTPWIKILAISRELEHRRFHLRKYPDIKDSWFIRLAPAFEESVTPDLVNTLGEASGIYRYLDASGQVIYIGKGIIRDRFKEPDRKEWGIVKIEFSVLHRDSDQYEWESLWIERHKEANRGQLPVYNRVGGRQAG